MIERSAKWRESTDCFSQGAVLTGLQVVLGGGHPPIEASQKVLSNSDLKHLVGKGLWMRFSDSGHFGILRGKHLNFLWLGKSWNLSPLFP